MIIYVIIGDYIMHKLSSNSYMLLC